MRNVSLKLAASLLVFLTATGPAAANDKKNYPGAACLASGTTNSNIARGASYGRAFNQATATTYFVCPAVKDYSSIAGGIAWVIDENPGSNQPVSCWLRSGRPDSLTVYTATDATEAANGTFSSPTPVKLTFGAVSAVSEGFYWLRCNVPGTHDGVQSGVVMYQIDEND